ncbi:MAG: LppX_LprAFG lipoprotein, partial [Chloroflexota bacterium]
MRLRLMLLTLCALLLAACGSSNAELPDPIDVLNNAGEVFNTAETFKIEVLQEGAPYFIETDVTEGALRFQRATMSYEAPDVIQGNVRATVFGAPFPFGVLARGEAQWVQLPGIGWTNAYYFAYGFNPQDLIAEETGFNAALNALLDIEMVGRESLDGIPVFHMTGRADGKAVTDLLVG